MPTILFFRDISLTHIPFLWPAAHPSQNKKHHLREVHGDWDAIITLRCTVQSEWMEYAHPATSQVRPWRKRNSVPFFSVTLVQSPYIRLDNTICTITPGKGGPYCTSPLPCEIFPSDPFHPVLLLQICHAITALAGTSRTGRNICA